ncbi:MAG: alpha/beta fold hydrolase [Prochlorotrichaceae cyanobacterium]|jgi:pimeloyl-ACP methyl ester carboxylesterase
MVSPSPLPPVRSLQWEWQGLSIRYQYCGDQGLPLLLIHGFGASSDHWRKNLPWLGQTYRVYALDLLGFGQSAKPAPGQPLAYTFETWGQQVLDFCQTVIGAPVYCVGNSIGAVVTLQAAVMDPTQILGVCLINCSLRLLHDRKRATLPWYRQWSAPLLQQVLSFKPLGYFFFQRLANPRTIRQILQQAYGNSDAVTDELVECILAPAQDPGAADVFLAFIQYSQGPLPEDLLPQLCCPALVLWGEADPWEPIALGKVLAQHGPTVTDFISLPGVGHCPQDEAPEQVNAALATWIQDQQPAAL